MQQEFFCTECTILFPITRLSHTQPRSKSSWDAVPVKKRLEYSSSLYCRGSPYVKTTATSQPHGKTLKCIFKIVCYVTMRTFTCSKNIPLQIQRCKKHANENLRVWLQCPSAKGTALIMDHPVPFCRQTIIRWPKKEQNKTSSDTSVRNSSFDLSASCAATCCSSTDKS